MKKLFTCLFIIAIAFTPQARAQQAGTLDSSFNTKGFNVIENSGNNPNEAFALAVQADGKAVIAGYIQYSDSEKLMVERYKTNGTLDSTFNGNGVFIFVTRTACLAGAVAIQNDGKIVIGGEAYDNSDNDDFLLLRLNSNGTPDNTFGVGGVVVSDFSDGQIDDIYCLAIQPDGKIIAAGTTVLNNNYGFAMMRFNTDGSLDQNTFGPDGRVYTSIGVGASMAYGIGLQADGKIVLGGYSVNSDTFLVSTVCRYKTNGFLDSTFNNTGIAVTDMNAFDNEIFGLSIQTDGKIVTCGYASNANNYGDFALARYNTDGTLDNTFNGTGKVITDFDGKSDNAYTVNIQPDGKIISCGVAFRDGQSNEFALARYNSNGTLDATFNTTGLVSTEVRGYDDEIYAAAFQPNGKLVVAGVSANPNNYNFAIARYLTGITTGVLNFNTPVNQCLIYPNPATTNTQLQYELQNMETITVQVFNLTGKLVSTVLNSQTQTAGKHSVTVNFANQLAAGTYFVRITNGSGQVSVKMVKGE